MDKYDRLTQYLRLVSLLLLIQFLLGMYVNLYVSIPTGTQSFADYMSASPVLAAHIVLAFFIVVADFMALFMAIHARIGNFYIFSVMVSLITIVAAGISGLLFLMAGQNNIYSYLMAFFFLISFAFLGFGMTGTRKAKS